MQTKEFVDNVSGSVKGALYPAVTDKQIRAEVVPLPPLREQNRIAAILNEQMAAVERARAATEAQLEAAKAFPAAYLRYVFPQPGQELPTGWQWAPLAQIGPLTDGDWILNADYSSSGVRLLQVGDIGVGNLAAKSSRFITLERAKELKCTLLQAGDILISRMPDPIGRACTLPDLGYLCITAVDVTVWRPDKDADRGYLTHYLSSSEWLSRVKELASGATRPRISRTNLEALTVPLPPLAEQKRIAALLNDQMAEVERASKAIEEELDAINKLPAALLRWAFNGAL